MFFFFKQKTAYEMRISDWSSDVCSSDLLKDDFPEVDTIKAMTDAVIEIRLSVPQPALLELLAQPSMAIVNKGMGWGPMRARKIGNAVLLSPVPDPLAERSEEHTSELQSLMRISYAVFCLKKKQTQNRTTTTT